MNRVDHSEASSKFIEAKDHLEFHDRRLWDLRKKRDRESEFLPEWEDLRSLASAIKEHTLSHLADYLEEFERNAKRNGAQVHWAKDAAEHNQIVFDIMSSNGASMLVKAKSMLTDECDMRPFLENRGIEVMETDLGERIQQLDDEPPSHIVVPAVHKLRGDVARHEVYAGDSGRNRTGIRGTDSVKDDKPTHCVRCNRKWPYRSGICGYCAAVPVKHKKKRQRPKSEPSDYKREYRVMIDVRGMDS